MEPERSSIQIIEKDFSWDTIQTEISNGDKSSRQFPKSHKKSANKRKNRSLVLLKFN